MICMGHLLHILTPLKFTIFFYGFVNQIAQLIIFFKKVIAI